jgi:hypothetical protein
MNDMRKYFVGDVFGYEAYAKEVLRVRKERELAEVCIIF